MRSLPRCAVPFTSDCETGAAARATFGRADLLRAALGARAPTWSSFPASKVVPSFRAHSPARNRLLLLGLAVRWSVRAGPPFPAPSAFAAAAIPRDAMAAIPRGSADGDRHPPGRVYGHHRRGVRPTTSTPTKKPKRGGEGAQPPMMIIAMALPADTRAGDIGGVLRPGSAGEQAARSMAQRASPRRR